MITPTAPTTSTGFAEHLKMDAVERRPRPLRQWRDVARLVLAMAALHLAVAPAHAAEAIGRLRSINQFAHTATLDNGDTFTVPESIDLTALRVGQMVTITYRGLGSGKRAIAIQPAS